VVAEPVVIARLASWVRFTRLPYGGGAVLVDGRALTVAECAESDAELVMSLLAGGPGPEPSPAQRALVADLLARSWLTSVEERR
jgi:hypothetical protein